MNMPRDRSGEHKVSDTFLLAMREEINEAIAPIKAGQDALAQSVNARLAQGDTEIALLKQRQDAQDRRCVAHAAEISKPKKLHPFLATFITGAIQTAAAALVAWVLLGGLAKGVQP
jgi:hypothetical protein